MDRFLLMGPSKVNYQGPKITDAPLAFSKNILNWEGTEEVLRKRVMEAADFAVAKYRVTFFQRMRDDIEEIKFELMLLEAAIKFEDLFAAERELRNIKSKDKEHLVELANVIRDSCRASDFAPKPFLRGSNMDPRHQTSLDLFKDYKDENLIMWFGKNSPLTLLVIRPSIYTQISKILSSAEQTTLTCKQLCHILHVLNTQTSLSEDDVFCFMDAILRLAFRCYHFTIKDNEKSDLVVLNHKCLTAAEHFIIDTFSVFSTTLARFSVQNFTLSSVSDDEIGRIASRIGPLSQKGNLRAAAYVLNYFVLRVPPFEDCKSAIMWQPDYVAPPITVETSPRKPIHDHLQFPYHEGLKGAAKLLARIDLAATEFEELKKLCLCSDLPLLVTNALFYAGEYEMTISYAQERLKQVEVESREWLTLRGISTAAKVRSGKAVEAVTDCLELFKLSQKHNLTKRISFESGGKVIENSVYDHPNAKRLGLTPPSIGLQLSKKSVFFFDNTVLGHIALLWLSRVLISLPQTDTVLGTRLVLSQLELVDESREYLSQVTDVLSKKESFCFPSLLDHIRSASLVKEISGLVYTNRGLIFGEAPANRKGLSTRGSTKDQWPKVKSGFLAHLKHRRSAGFLDDYASFFEENSKKLISELKDWK